MKFKKTIIAPLIVASIVVANFGSAFATISGASPNEISEFKILEVTSEPTDTDSQKDLEIIFKSKIPLKIQVLTYRKQLKSAYQKRLYHHRHNTTKVSVGPPMV